MLDRASLDSAKRALERRLAVDGDAFGSLDDLQQFVDTRGNSLKLTAPRPVKVFDPPQDLDRLFDELVGGVARRPSTEPAAHAQMAAVFHKLEQEGRAKVNWDVTVPVVGRALRVPYAYRNGVWNLVKPHYFPSQERSAIRSALQLAIEGDLLYRHETEEGGKKQLIVVSSFDQGQNAADIQGRVNHVLQEYNVKTVGDAQVSEFLTQVAKDAH
jgi:hypothetical protein